MARLKNFSNTVHQYAAILMQMPAIQGAKMYDLTCFIMMQDSETLESQRHKTANVSRSPLDTRQLYDVLAYPGSPVRAALFAG